MKERIKELKKTVASDIRDLNEGAVSVLYYDISETARAAMMDDAVQRALDAIDNCFIDELNS